jgi:hypothetical protein
MVASTRYAGSGACVRRTAREPVCSGRAVACTALVEAHHAWSITSNRDVEEWHPLFGTYRTDFNFLRAQHFSAVMISRAPSVS